LIEENSSMIDAQQFKKRLDVGIAKVETLRILMNEKQSLCSELHSKTMALERVFTEKNELYERLQKLEAQFANSDVFLQQINYPKKMDVDTAISGPLIPIADRNIPRDNSSQKNIEVLSSNFHPLKGIPLAEKIVFSEKNLPKIEEKTNSENNSETSRDTTPARYNSGGRREEFVEVSLSNQFEIDESLKPTDKLVIPVKEERSESWLRGWSSVLWDVVTGRV